MIIISTPNNRLIEERPVKTSVQTGRQAVLVRSDPYRFEAMLEARLAGLEKGGLTE